MAITSTQRTEIVKVVVGLFDAAPGAVYLNEFAAYAGNPAALTNDLVATPAFQSLYSNILTSEEFAAKFVGNLVGGAAAQAEIDWAVNWMTGLLEGGETRAEAAFKAIAALSAVPADDALWGAAATQFANKVAVAEFYSVNLGGTSTDLGALQGVLANVTADSDVSSDAAIVALIGGGASTGNEFTLTQRADNLTGNAADNEFEAPVTQNETGSGELANTFETGDVLNGGGGRNMLKADLIDTGTIGDNQQGAAISAKTENIQEVYFRAQTVRADNADNTTNASTIDAENMVGVEEWWSEGSRSDIRIEDVRERSDAVAIGMRLTDPNVDYEVYFNPLFMDGDIAQTESSITLTIQDITPGRDTDAVQLENITVRELNFTFDGVQYTLDTPEARAANTWAELEAAIAEAMAAAPALAALTVEHRGSGVFVIEDPNSGAFEVVDGESVIVGASANSDTRARADIGQPVTIEGPTSTTVVLDGVGQGSQGGNLNIAAMSGDRGVEVFNVFVDRDSHLSLMESENSPQGGVAFGLEQQLEVVNVAHATGDLTYNDSATGALGTFQVGDRTVDVNGVSTTTDDRLRTNGTNDGLVDVRVLDASDFTSFMKVAAIITANAFDKYLARVTDEDPVPGQFQYLMGDGGSNLSLDVNNNVATDVDFSLEYVGGAGDDRLNLSTVIDKGNVSVDGGAGNNIIELTASTGAATAFEAFENIQTLVIAGGGSVQNLVDGNMLGLDTVIIATNNNTNVEVQELASDQELIISGKNQTLGTGNNNNNQLLNVVTLTNTTVVPGDTGLDVLLQNTARVDGVLTVNNLVVAGVDNEVTTLNIESGGVRDTSNVVSNFNGEDVTNLNLVGTQDLSIHVATIAAGATVDAVIDGSALTGDLVLAVNAAELDGGADDELIGTAGANDVVALYGNVTTNTDVSGFETMQFGWLVNSDLDAVFPAPQAASGLFDAANTTGVNTYIVGNTGANLTFGVTSLRSGNVVQLGDTSVNPGIVTQAIYTGATLALTLTGAGATAQTDLTINAIAELDDAQFQAGEVTLNVNNFTNVTMDIDRSDSNAAENLFFTATLDDDARTLTLTGGNADEDISLTQEGELNTSLTRVDISGFAGEVDLGVWDSLVGTNATIVVNGYDFTFDVGGDNTVSSVAAGVVANVAEVNTVTYAAAANDLDIGESITITFAGSSYVFTNTTAAAINAANLNAAIIADATNAPAGFNIADNGGGLIQLTATTFGDLSGAVPTLAPAVTTTDANLGAPVVANAVVGDTSSVTGFDLVTVAPEFITSFDFNVDANELGVLWQIDNFYAFEAGVNVGLGNQSIIDLRDLDVDSATDIVVQDGAVYWVSLTGDEQNDIWGGVQGDFVAGNTVITSNEDLNFTILLTGVAVSDLVNENIAGIA